MKTFRMLQPWKPSGCCNHGNLQNVATMDTFRMLQPWKPLQCCNHGNLQNVATMYIMKIFEVQLRKTSRSRKAVRISFLSCLIILSSNNKREKGKGQENHTLNIHQIRNFQIVIFTFSCDAV